MDPLSWLKVFEWIPEFPETWLILKECILCRGGLGETCSVFDDPTLLFFPRRHLECYGSELKGERGGV